MFKDPFNRKRATQAKKFVTMNKIEIQPIIGHIIKVLQLFGMWRRNDKSRCLQCVEMIQKIFSLITLILLFASLSSGSYISEDMSESVYLSAASVASALMVIKLTYVISKPIEIHKFLNEICVHSAADSKEFDEISVELNNFAKFGYANIFSMLSSISFFIIMSLPFFSSETRLPLNIGFPLDWRSSTISYVLAHSFVVIAVVVAMVVTFFTIIYWYVMFNCSIKYKLLGNRIQRLGEETRSEKTLREQHVVKELIELIQIHRHIQEYEKITKSYFT